MLKYTHMGGQEALQSLTAELPAETFCAKFEHYWTRLSEDVIPLVDAPTLEELKQLSFAKEQRFRSKVLNGVEEAVAIHGGVTLCLLDVDDTIADRADDGDMLLRPSFPYILQELKSAYGLQVQFGLLSIRPQASLEEAMAQSSFLNPVKQHINANLLFSAAEEVRNDPLFDSGVTPDELRNRLAYLSGIVMERVLAETAIGARELLDWYNPKLTVVSKLLKSYGESAFVVVDDLPWPEILDLSNQRLTGVCVAEETQLLVPGIDF